jgi:murein DD-endopeptidase MepM/ murein hydrolase activator NlpD
MANLNLARAADEEIASQLRAITEEANLTVEKIEEAKQRLERAKELAERSEELLQSSGDQQNEIEASLMLKAIEGYKTQTIGAPGLLFTEVSVNEAIRQNQLLNEASSSTTELLEELRRILEDRRLANAEAERAAVDAERAQTELEEELATLQEQQELQLGLKAEAERRIDQWAGELTAYAREDAAIQSLIGRSAAPATTTINNPTNPSALGFQWPIQAPVTSEYGYRIHPVYGTRRLHAGMDLGAPRGTPIAASTDGVVIFAGTQGGYGRTVIIDHGGGITTLYGHMSEIGASQGQTVSRGDIVGFVGATGTATGNHLHFEVRVNGGAVNPRNYLP